MVINTKQILIGIIVLFAGALVYVTDRPAESSFFMNNFFPNFSLFEKIPGIFGLCGNNLPAFTHVLSFSLLTAGFTGTGKTDYKTICFFWFFVNSLFEVGQKYSYFVIKLTSIESLQLFFINGTFDFLDILAFIAGGIIAYPVLIFTGNKELTI